MDEAACILGTVSADGGPAHLEVCVEDDAKSSLESTEPFGLLAAVDTSNLLLRSFDMRSSPFLAGP
jgi:hypothetical protein